MDKEKRKISCTFTGHRPEKLDADEEHVIEWLKKEIGKAVDVKSDDVVRFESYIPDEAPNRK